MTVGAGLCCESSAVESLQKSVTLWTSEFSVYKRLFPQNLQQPLVRSRLRVCSASAIASVPTACPSQLRKHSGTNPGGVLIMIEQHPQIHYHCLLILLLVIFCWPHTWVFNLPMTLIEKLLTDIDWYIDSAKCVAYGCYWILLWGEVSGMNTHTTGLPLDCYGGVKCSGTTLKDLKGQQLKQHKLCSEPVWRLSWN